MRNHTIRRTVRTSILSTLLALVAFSFLTIGGVSAHPISQTSSLAQTGSNCPANTVHIKFMPFGPNALELVFTCNSMTVKAGAPVVFVDDAHLEAFIVKPGTVHIMLEVAAGSTATLPTSQLGQVQVAIYGTPHPQALLTITVVA